MGVNIVDSEGKPKIKIDDSDQEKDVVVEDGKEVPYEEAAAEKEKEIQKAKDEKKDKGDKD